MNALSIALGFLAIASALSAGLLVGAARRKPRIGALTERAFLAVKDAVFGIVCVALVWNTDTSQALLPLEVARLLFRGLLFVNLMIPPFWLALWFTNRLGGNVTEFIEAERARIREELDALSLAPSQRAAVLAVVDGR